MKIGENELDRGLFSIPRSVPVERGKGGGGPVSANSGRMRKSRLCRLAEERRVSARRIFAGRLPSWGENWRHAMRIFSFGEMGRFAVGKGGVVRR